MRFNFVKFLCSFFLVTLCFFGHSTNCFGQKSKKSKPNEENVSREGELYFTEGMKHYILEDYQKAMLNFKKALNINPKNAAVHYIISEVLAKEKNYSEALVYSQKALDLEDKNKYYYTALGKNYENLQRYQNASEVYEKLLKSLPNTYETYFDLASNYILLTKYDEAIKCYNKIEEIFGISEEVVRQKQQIYLKQNNLDAALAEGKKLITFFPDDPLFKLFQAELLVSNNKVEEGLTMLESIIKDHPEEANARLMLWEIYKGKGDDKKAEENLLIGFKNPELDLTSQVKIIVDYINLFPDEKAKAMGMKLGKIFLETHPDDATAYTIYGDLLRHDNKKEEALTYYSKASKLDESNFNVWQWMVSLNFDLNKVDSAIKFSDKALELFPNQPEFWYFSGVGYFMKKNYKRSTESLEQAKSLSAANQSLTNQINTILGDAYNNLKDYKKSDEAYQDVLKNNPNDDHVLNNFSYFLSLRKERLDFAKQLSSKLVEQHPENATYLDTHGWVLYMGKEYKESFIYLEKAAKLAPSGAILEHLGDVLYQLGDKDKALEQWKRAKDLGDVSTFLNKKIADKVLYE